MLGKREEEVGAAAYCMQGQAGNVFRMGSCRVVFRGKAVRDRGASSLHPWEEGGWSGGGWRGVTQEETRQESGAAAGSHSWVISLSA